MLQQQQIIYHLRLDHKENQPQGSATDTSEEHNGTPVDKQFMVPSLLPEDPVEGSVEKEWPRDRGEGIIEYGRIYELNDFIPIGLFARLIVRIMHIPGT